MSNHDCDCAAPAADETDAQPTESDRWLDARPIETAAFPQAVADNMSRFFGTPIDTFDDVVTAIRTAVEGDGIAIDDLCHVDGETPHVARTADETHYFRCFYDGVALAHLADEPVEIRTETPAGEPIEIRASPEGGVDVTPSGAVMSFGLATGIDVSADETPAARDVYGAVCPYVKAFSTREGYERWAPDVAATTVGMPLDAGVPVAAALTGPAPADSTD